ncbi:HSF5 protein, partial [Pitta sordida]|nr:HSF5 protein [Pitta sordida]
QALGLLVDRALFERELLSAAGDVPPVALGVFKATRFGSFICQLNLYGFHKVSTLPGDNAKKPPYSAGPLLQFSSPCFRRDRPDLLLHIRRLTKANRQRLAAGLEPRSRRPSRFQQ